MQDGASVYIQGFFKKQRPEAKDIRAIVIIQGFWPDIGPGAS